MSKGPVRSKFSHIFACEFPFGGFHRIKFSREITFEGGKEGKSERETLEPPLLSNDLVQTPKDSAALPVTPPPSPPPPPRPNPSGLLVIQKRDVIVHLFIDDFPIKSLIFIDLQIHTFTPHTRHIHFMCSNSNFLLNNFFSCFFSEHIYYEHIVFVRFRIN